MIMTRHKVWTLTTIGFFFFGSQAVVCPLSGQSLMGSTDRRRFDQFSRLFEPNNVIS